jgi:hypothetical protein
MNRIKQKYLFTPSLSSIPTRKAIKDQYDYYFRIDYMINQAACKSIRMFNTTTNIASIQYLVKQILISFEFYSLFCLDEFNS